MRPEIVFENEQLVVCNKPAGLLSIPDREGKDVSLKILLQEKFGKIFTIHRLDRETSGLIVFAKDEETHKFLSEAFESRKVEKYYLGIVTGVLPEKKKTIHAPIMEHSFKKGTMIVHSKGKESITDYEVEQEYGKFSLVKFRIHTGRTHQIRVHMQNEGHPIVCDELYGDAAPIRLSMIKKNYKLSKNEEEERPILARLGLHAWKLKIPLPTGESMEFESPLPKDMRALLQQLDRLNAKKQR
jgi:23S rRNA pseudouridine955/2504/2580 synthase/23S rRNA pseudouridine1911/1915/1917 synthase